MVLAAVLLGIKERRMQCSTVVYEQGLGLPEGSQKLRGRQGLEFHLPPFSLDIPGHLSAPSCLHL